MKHLDGVGDKDIVGLNIPTGVPLVYELDASSADPARIPRRRGADPQGAGGRRPAGPGAKVLAALSDVPQTAEQLAAAAGAPEAVESVFLILEHLAANGRARIADAGRSGGTTFRSGGNAGR